MVPLTVDKAPNPYVSAKACWRCTAKRQHDLPLVDDVPEELVGLPSAVYNALPPLEMDSGPEIRSWQSAGYRQHACMVTFSWHKQSVKERMEALTAEEQAQGQAAYDWLWYNNEKYKELVMEQNQFLANKPNATDKERKRWLRFLERPGVECGVWPHLFYRVDLCFTIERDTDPRKAQRQRKLQTTEQRMFGPYDEIDPMGEEAEDDTVLHSIRR
eukprot:5632524-Karenia_brevis.AAC.1